MDNWGARSLGQLGKQWEFDGNSKKLQLADFGDYRGV